MCDIWNPKTASFLESTKAKGNSRLPKATAKEEKEYQLD